MFTKPTKANAKASHFALIYPNCALQASYVYDDLNQLIRENNATANKTWVYTYDERGNILSKDTYAYTTGTLGAVEDSQPYWYYDQWSTEAWGDVLRAYDYSPYFSYDSIGNPLVYIRDGSLFNFTWQNGRQLASGTKGSTSFAYTYNADGLRTKKVVDGVTTEYYWAGSQLAMMIVNPDLPTEKVLKFHYDAEGRPLCLDFNGTVYLYITNLQGDVVALADQYGEVIRYEYDAWGKPISTYYVATPYHDAMYYNPLRYRGYIYDNETGFYYLQSRYYDPVVGRFINADTIVAGEGETPTESNLFAYCLNNPVNLSDPSGHWAEWFETAAKVASGVALVVSITAVVVAVSAVSAGTASPAAILFAGAALGAVVAGINSGIANEADGDSYYNGYVGGMTGSIIQSVANELSFGSFLSGAIGSAIGTEITLLLDNIDPYSANTTPLGIGKAMATSGITSGISSYFTSVIGKGVDNAVEDQAAGLMPTLTPAFGKGIKAFFGWVNDAVVYFWGESYE